MDPEVVDVVTDLVGVGAARALEGCTGQDAEPDLDLIEPTGTGGSAVALVLMAVAG